MGLRYVELQFYCFHGTGRIKEKYVAIRAAESPLPHTTVSRQESTFMCATFSTTTRPHPPPAAPPICTHHHHQLIFLIGKR
jgi:hypothetical protein